MKQASRWALAVALLAVAAACSSPTATNEEPKTDPKRDNPGGVALVAPAPADLA